MGKRKRKKYDTNGNGIPDIQDVTPKGRPEYEKHPEKLKIGKPTFGDIAKLKAHKIVNNPAVKMVTRRVGKTASALLNAWVLNKIGMPTEIVVGSIPAYMAAEKAANVEMEKKTGKPQNLDWASLIYKLLALLFGRLFKKGAK